MEHLRHPPRVSKAAIFIYYYSHNQPFVFNILLFVCLLHFVITERDLVDGLSDDIVLMEIIPRLSRNLAWDQRPVLNLLSRSWAHAMIGHELLTCDRLYNPHTLLFSPLEDSLYIGLFPQTLKALGRKISVCGRGIPLLVSQVCSPHLQPICYQNM